MYLLVGKLFSFGRNYYGQLGLEGVEQVAQPTEVPLPPEIQNAAIEQIDCGSEHSAFLDGSSNPLKLSSSCRLCFAFFLENGQAYMCGWNEHGQLGVGGEESSASWKRLYFPHGTPVRRLFCGDGFNIALGAK